MSILNAGWHLALFNGGFSCPLTLAPKENVCERNKCMQIHPSVGAGRFHEGRLPSRSPTPPQGGWRERIPRGVPVPQLLLVPIPHLPHVWATGTWGGREALRTQEGSGVGRQQGATEGSGAVEGDGTKGPYLSSYSSNKQWQRSYCV